MRQRRGRISIPHRYQDERLWHIIILCNTKHTSQVGTPHKRETLSADTYYGSVVGPATILYMRTVDNIVTWRLHRGAL